MERVEGRAAVTRRTGGDAHVIARVSSVFGPGGSRA